MSVVLTRVYGGWQEVGLMLLFVGIAFGAARVALGARPPRLIGLLTRTMESSSQLPVRISILLVAVFVVLSEQFGFEAAPGAFAAGMVVGLATQGPEARVLRVKIEAVCFGFFVPFFYVLSGIKFDLPALGGSTAGILMLPMFLALLFLVRGASVLLYRDVLARDERLPFALYAATTLPLVVAIAEIGVRTRHMRPDMAAPLVGAAMLSVLLFPAVAGALRARRPPGSRDTDLAASRLAK